MVNKTIIIYMPSGHEVKYTTSKEVVDSDCSICGGIEEHKTGSVSIYLKDADGKRSSKSYVGIPYMIEYH